ncbi:flagellar hook-length control protein FliK [Vogesella oryzae]|uniref:flagellar hook-length control protein FliK n=1 Tax=Vogesella oryzae TaxID=1735285 RepID=UPI001582792E|nr:flagellar hook-length control protein FliK [Vogesella oryzae]
MLSTLSVAGNDARPAPLHDSTLPAAQPEAAASPFGVAMTAASPDAQAPVPATDVASVTDDSVAAADAAPADGDSDSSSDNAAANLAQPATTPSPLLAQLPQLPLPPAPLAEAKPAPQGAAGDDSSTDDAARLRVVAAALPASAPAVPALPAGGRHAGDNITAANLAPGAADAANPPLRAAAPLPVAASREQLAGMLAAGSRLSQDHASEPGSDAVTTPSGSSSVSATALPQGGQSVPPAQWAPLKLPAAQPAQWAQPLQQALGERLHVQAANGIDNAVIRLDPAHLGTLEIAIRHEAGSLQVQLTAGNSELLRQLHAISDNLRQGLGNRQYGEVAVWVADSRQQGAGQGGQGRQGDEPREQRPNRALYQAGQDNGHNAFTLA